VIKSYWIGESGPKYTCHGRFTEQFLESQPGSGASFTVTGGFLNAATMSLKKVTGRIFKNYLVSVFKEARKTCHLITLAIKPKKILKSPAHILKVMIYLHRPLKKNFI